MSEVEVGRVGRAHGRDGSFYVEGPAHPLAEGTELRVAGEPRRVERRGGTAERPLVRLSGVEDPEAVARLRGEPLLVDEQLAAGEFLARDLEGCSVEGLAPVARVLEGPSCSVLELEDGTLVPFVSDAVRRVDLAGRTIEVDREFLGLDT